MRILFFADNFPPEVNAPATHIYERCRLWVEMGHHVTVITCAPNYPAGRVYPGYRNALRQIENVDGIRVVRVWTYIAPNRGRLRRMIDYASFTPSATWAALGEGRPDVVISSSPHLLVPLAGTLYCLLRRRPHVFELRDLWPASAVATASLRRGWFYRLLQRLEMAMYRRATRVLAFTQSYRDDLVQRGISGEKIDVVYGAASCDLPPAGPRNASYQRDGEIEQRYRLVGRFVVGYIGTLGLAHGLENAIGAAELLRSEPITFLLAGAGAQRDALASAASERGLDNMVFAPQQPRSEIARYWSVCDAALVHLRNDPLFATVVPSKIFEAMSQGRPIVYAGPDGEAAELIRRHRAGITVPAADAEALATAVKQLADDSALCRELGENSQAAAVHYSRQRQAEGTLEVLTAAANGPHRSS